MEQLANLLKNIKGKLTQQSIGHYREMAWLPFQKFMHTIYTTWSQSVIFISLTNGRYHN